MSQHYQDLKCKNLIQEYVKKWYLGKDKVKGWLRNKTPSTVHCLNIMKKYGAI